MFQGHPLLREKLAEFFSPMFKSGIARDINPNTEILIANGACGALFCAIHHLIKPGDEVLMFEPYYTQYVNYIEFGGGVPKTVPMSCAGGKDWVYDLDLFESSLTPKTKLVILTNPHNPTGKIFTKSELERLTEILNKRPDILVISDDPYFFLPFDNR